LPREGLTRWRVVIADDEALPAELLRRLVTRLGHTVVGVASGGAEVVELTRQLHPDVVLLDVQLPDLDGFAVAEQLAAAPDPPRVVLISSRDAAAYGPRVQAAGARGFLAKRELSGASLAALVA